MKTFDSPSETNYPALFLAKSFSGDLKFLNSKNHKKYWKSKNISGPSNRTVLKWIKSNARALVVRNHYNFFNETRINLKSHVSIQYLTMNGSWADYHRGKEFIGNTKTDEIEIITLPLPIRTNIIRLFIQGWAYSNEIFCEISHFRNFDKIFVNFVYRYCNEGI